MERKKKHADFQDEYRKSSNFGRDKKDDDLEIKGDGELKPRKDGKMKSEDDKKQIEETLDKLTSEEE